MEEKTCEKQAGTESVGNGMHLCKHLSDVFSCELLHKTFLRSDQLLGKLQFLLLEGEYLLFDGISCDKFIGKDLFLLADAMSAVDGLRFNGRIPPWIENEDIIRFGKI